MVCELSSTCGRMLNLGITEIEDSREGVWEQCPWGVIGLYSMFLQKTTMKFSTRRLQCLTLPP